VLDESGLEMLDRPYFPGNPNYSPPFNWRTDVPMTTPLAVAHIGDRAAWIDGGNVWVGRAAF
jgi:hypothetical protein